MSIVTLLSMSNSFDIDHVEDDIDTDAESDKYSDISMDSYHPSDATSRTTVSMRSSSPTPSVYSVTSSLRARSIRYEHGRGLNNYSEVYRLPADDAEIERLGQLFSFRGRVSYSTTCRPTARNVQKNYGEISPFSAGGIGRRCTWRNESRIGPGLW